MTGDGGTAKGGKGGSKAERERRLAESLRDNLLKRKAQARGRRAGEADPRVGLDAAQPAADDKPDNG